MLRCSSTLKNHNPMKRILIASLLIVACKKSTSTNSDNNASIKYEVKVTGAASWSGNYLDATDAATLVQSQTNTDWTVTFTNQVPSARYLQIQVISMTPSNPSLPMSVIATIYVNGSVVKSDTASGYEGLFILPLSIYLLQ